MIRRLRFCFATIVTSDALSRDASHAVREREGVPASCPVTTPSEARIHPALSLSEDAAKRPS